MVSNVKVSSKFQISIPAEVRERFGIQAGDELTWTDGGGMLKLMKPLSFEATGGYLTRLGYQTEHVHPHEIRDKDDRDPSRHGR